MLNSQSNDFYHIYHTKINKHITIQQNPNLNNNPPLYKITSKVDPLDLKGEWTFEMRMFDRTPPLRVWVAIDNVMVWPARGVPPRFSSEVERLQMTVPVRPGKHVVTAECTDRFGSVSRARMETFAN